MKKLLAILLLVCISCQYVVQLGIVHWYEANKEYVAKVLCENKDKPELKCCGKCFVKKQLAKTGDTPAGKDAPVKQIKAEAFFILPAGISVDLNIVSTTSKKFSLYTCIPYRLLVKDIFHPPSFC